MEGVVVVDKPPGQTSHDVVRTARKKLQTRAVGHAGTLDPMATGVLVLAVGRATKLVPWLTVSDKRYRATLRLGIATHSLDADGDVVGNAPIPTLTPDAVAREAERFVGGYAQRAPVVSALRVDGKRLHERVRKGEKVEAPVRDVMLHSVSIEAVNATEIQFELHCGKGFYVRSFGRDLAEALGTLGHLSALRRTSSGPFSLEDAIDHWDDVTPLSLADAAGRLMPVVHANDDGFNDARHGRKVGASGIEGALPPSGEAALLYQGQLAALVAREGDLLRVLRGFVQHG
ncbi:MAG: tRNA pseudouridine(55) synthase TruB [Myxococcota bacterium]